MPRFPAVFAAMGILLFCPAAPHASAQEVERVRVEVDNDNFNFWLHRNDRPDYEYTHGSRVVVTSRGAAGWGRLLLPRVRPCEDDERPEQRCLQTAWELGQRIYTPRTNSDTLVEAERPHAGWLYGAATTVAQRASDRHSLRVEVGTTGPPSLAEFMQVQVHRLGGYWEPRGWKNQLRFEPGVLVGYAYERVLAAPVVGGVRVAEVTSEAGASAGNVITGGGAGVAARVGINVPHSWRAEAREAAPRAAAYLLGGVRADTHLRNLFLDGNTFEEGHHVAKRPVVGRYHLGAAARIDRVEITFKVVTRTREYRTEPGGHRFSSIGVTFQP